ncbi:MAG: hypothetical protein AAFV71_17665 [Cyanobacteria bacterium J06633_8]
MKSNIDVKGSTLIATIAGLLLTGASIISFVSSDNKSVKNFSFNFGLLTFGITVGSLAASNLMANKVMGEDERVTNKFTDEIKLLDRANTDLKSRLNKQNTAISSKEDKLLNLERLVSQKETIIQKLKFSLDKLQTETRVKQEELDHKLAKENRDRADLYQELLELFVFDLNYKIDESYNQIGSAVESKLNNPKYTHIKDKLQEFWHKLSTSLAKSRKLLIELKEIEFSTTEITDIYFQISDEITTRKVQYRNLLNTVERVTLREFEAELQERRNPKNFVSREKVLTALDDNHKYYSTQKLTFQAALDEEFNNLNDLRDNVNDLIDQIDGKNLEIANLKSEINKHRSPLKWNLANSRELEIGNMIIDYFWKQGTGYYLDRSFHESDGYECKLYFQIDRNPRQIVESELNDRSEELQQYCRALKPITFKYSGAKGLMVATVTLKEKPKSETSEASIRRICKPAEVFKAAVGGYERWRVTGGSQAGKSPTAQFLAEAISTYNSKEVNVRLFNPQHGSKKDNWQYKAEGKNAEECLKGFTTLGQEIKQRQGKKKSTDKFDLFLFDELDSVIDEMGATQVKQPLRYAIKQASHQDVGIIIIGQSSAANVVPGMTWSDWNSTAQLHLGDNAKLFIENRWKNESELRDEYLKQFATVRDYYERKNYEAGLSVSDYGYYRFAFIAIPNHKPYFIEIPAFIFEDKEKSMSTNTQKSLSTNINSTPVVEPSKPVSEEKGNGAECPRCKSTNIGTKGKEYWRCRDCDRSWKRK